MYGGAHAAHVNPEFMANYDQHHCSLIVVPEEVDSFVCVNVLNYYGFPAEVEEDNVSLMRIKKEMGFKIEEPYPCLIINSNSPELPTVDMAGTESILKFL